MKSYKFATTPSLILLQHCWDHAAGCHASSVTSGVMVMNVKQGPFTFVYLFESWLSESN